MSLFPVATKMNKETENEKCPKCLTIWQDFGKIEEHLWFCYSCGTVFVPKKIREPEKWGKKEQILKQMAEEKEKEEALKKEQEGVSAETQSITVDESQMSETITAFACPHCDYVGKTKANLGAHMRKHKDDRETE